MSTTNNFRIPKINTAELATIDFCWTVRNHIQYEDHDNRCVPLRVTYANQSKRCPYYYYDEKYDPNHLYIFMANLVGHTNITDVREGKARWKLSFYKRIDRCKTIESYSYYGSMFTKSSQSIGNGNGAFCQRPDAIIDIVKRFFKVDKLQDENGSDVVADVYRNRPSSLYCPLNNILARKEQRPSKSAQKLAEQYCGAEAVPYGTKNEELIKMAQKSGNKSGILISAANGQPFVICYANVDDGVERWRSGFYNYKGDFTHMFMTHSEQMLWKKRRQNAYFLMSGCTTNSVVVDKDAFNREKIGYFVPKIEKIINIKRDKDSSKFQNSVFWSLVTMVENPLFEKILDYFDGNTYRQVILNQRGDCNYILNQLFGWEHYCELTERKNQDLFEAAGMTKEQILKFEQNLQKDEFTHFAKCFKTIYGKHDIRDIAPEQFGEYMAVLDKVKLIKDEFGYIGPFDRAQSIAKESGGGINFYNINNAVLLTTRERTLQPYLDYLRMFNRAKNLELKIDKNHFKIIPDSTEDMLRLHDELSDILKDVVSQGLQTLYDTRAKQNSKFECEDDNYAIVTPKSAQEVVYEGQVQHICIGTYAERYAMGDTDLFFLRQKSEPNVPWFAIEVRNNKLIQCHGMQNRWLGSTDESFAALPFVARWLEKHNIDYSQNILTNIATGYGCSSCRPWPQKAYKAYKLPSKRKEKAV